MVDELTPLIPNPSPVAAEERISTGSHVDEEEIVENKRSWVVLAAGALGILTVDGALYSNGMLTNALKIAEDVNSANIEYVGSVQVFSCCLVSLIAEMMSRKLGPKGAVALGGGLATAGWILAGLFGTSFFPLALFWGVLTGVGFGLIFVPSLTAVAEVFSTRRNLALGLAASASGFAQVLICPMVKGLLELGWRAAFVVLGALSFLVAAVAWNTLPPQLRTKPPTRQTDEAAQLPKVLTLLLGCSVRARRHVAALLLSALGDGLAVLGLYMPYTFIPQDWPDIQAIVLLMLIGLGSACGRVGAGWLCNGKMEPRVLTPLGTSLAGIAALFINVNLLSSFPLVSGLNSILFGLASGAWISATSPLLDQLVGLPQVNNKLFYEITFGQKSKRSQSFLSSASPWAGSPSCADLRALPLQSLQNDLILSPPSSHLFPLPSQLFCMSLPSSSIENLIGMLRHLTRIIVKRPFCSLCFDKHLRDECIGR